MQPLARPTLRGIEPHRVGGPSPTLRVDLTDVRVRNRARREYFWQDDGATLVKTPPGDGAAYSAWSKQRFGLVDDGVGGDSEFLIQPFCRG